MTDDAPADVRALLEHIAALEALRQEFEVRDAVAATLYPHIERLRTFIAQSGSRGDFVEEAAANLIDHQQQRIDALEAALREIRDKPSVATTNEDKTYVRGFNHGTDECRRIVRAALD